MARMQMKGYRPELCTLYSARLGAILMKLQPRGISRRVVQEAVVNANVNVSYKYYLIHFHYHCSH